MARFLHSICSFTFRKWDKFLLALSWVTGLGAGGFVFRYVCSDFVSQMPLAAVCQPSIFGLLSTAFLPFLFFIFAVYLRISWLLYGVCFIKAFLFGYMSTGILAAFGSAGWLVRWLLLFTDLAGAAVLYLFCHRHISGTRRFHQRSAWVYVSVLFLAVWMDYDVISPLLRRCLL